MHVLDLPREVIASILSRVSARSLLRASITCKALKRIADTVGLRVTVTSQTWGIGRWLRSPDIARRVWYLHAKNALWNRSYAFLGGMYNLRVLIISFCRVQSSIFRFLPDTLRHLDIHMLGGSDPTSIFTTSRLTHLKNLDVLKITCDTTLPLVIVSDIPASVTLLQIRRAPAMVISGVLRVPYVSVHAVSVLVCEHGIVATSLVAMCDYGPLNLGAMLHVDSYTQLEDLTLVSPCLADVHIFGRLSRVRHLRLRVHSVTLDSLPPQLKDLDIEASYGFGMRRPMPASVATACVKVDDVLLCPRDLVCLTRI